MITIIGFNLRGWLFAATVLTGLSFGPHASAQQIGRAYLVDLNSRTATDLGTLGGNYSAASAINDAGQVVGYSEAGSEDRWHAFITGPDGVGMRDLGKLGGNLAFNDLLSINDAGQVAGYSDTAEGNLQAFITGPNGTGMRNLGTLGGDGSVALAINNAGQVAGFAATVEDNNPHAFITGPDGMGMRDLGTLGGWGSYALGINDAGQVVGRSVTEEFFDHAFIATLTLSGPRMRDLGTLARDSSANGINEAGQAVGVSFTDEGLPHAFITGADGMGMTDLGTLGGNISHANGINDAGQVVGASSTAEGLGHAFITGADGVGMTDLNSLVHLPDGWVLTDATGINNAGQVIAAAIPEPENYALLLAGLALIAAVVRPKKDTGALPAPS